MSAQKGNDNQKGVPPPLPPQQQATRMAPFMPPTQAMQMQYPGAPPPGYAPFPSVPPLDPTRQQQLLQIQIRQQQLHLQQMQQQQQAAAQQQQQHQQQQHTTSPPQQQQQQQQHHQQQQQFASFTTTTTPHFHTNKHQSPQTPAAPPPTNTSKQQKTSASPVLHKKPAPPPPSSEQVKQWLAQCDWKDRTIYVSRQIMGGSSINGFARATSTVQRIKKQRARQVAALHKKKSEAESIPLPVQTPLELQLEIMNPRTVKKMNQEFQQGAAFCQNLYETIQGIMRELDPASVPPPIQRLTSVVPKMPSIKKTSTYVKPTTSMYSNKKTKTTPTAPPPGPVRAIVPTTTTTAAPATTLPGSALRKQRKRKLAIPPLQVNLSEHDATGKRIFTKRQHYMRIAEVLRFRALRAGDYVAAKTSSRDLWILARVVQDYLACNMDPNEFLKLTPAKRDSLFREKVMVKDAEEKASAEPILLSRQLVLPLPRTYGEAAEWGTRLKKGLRIYAMYPHTTSLYVATVVDNTTFCRGDDDIIVVEFDEDERDASGALPKCHIPARFVVMIPREYQTTKKATESKRASKMAATSSAQQPAQSDLALNGMLGDMNDAMEDFQELVDFGCGGGSGV